MIWCEEHKAQDFVEAWNPPQLEESHSCVVGVETGGSCRMVEALLIVKENGQWPESLISTMRGVSWTEWGDDFYERMLDALASSTTDTARAE